MGPQYKAEENIKIPKLNEKKIVSLLRQENQYIENIWKKHPQYKNLFENGNKAENINHAVEQSKPKAPGDKKNRAKNWNELQAKLETMKGKRLNYQEKLKKRTLKNKITKQKKKEKRKLKKTIKEILIKPNNEVDSKDILQKSDIKPVTEVYNSDGKMVFSKIDVEVPDKQESKKKKTVKNPEKILEKLKKQKDNVQKLESEGKVEKVVQIKDKIAWENALQRAEGIKVKDDPLLLKKSIQRQKSHKRKSQKLWLERTEQIKKQQAARQMKRKENIKAKLKKKKVTKLKKAAKKGKVIPGF